jgi:Tfp pilus assembly protein PilX
MSRRLSHSGFTLITALFLLVVVALLSVYMINFRSVQQSTLVYGVQGARAMLAARTGLEWGIDVALTTNACPSNTPFSTSGAGNLDTFTIQVGCTESDHIEGSLTIKTFQLTSSAWIGNFGSLDYVFRSLQASVSTPPP